MTRISFNAEQTPVSASAPPRTIVSSAAPGIPPGPPQPQSSPSVRSAWRESEPKEDDVLVESEHLFQQAPPWLFSAAIHMVLLIALGLWFFSTGRDANMTLNLRYNERLGTQLDEESIELLANDKSMQELAITPQDLRPVEDPIASPQLLDDLSPTATATASPLLPQPLGNALSGREIGSKQVLLGAYGGDATTEAAVMEALRWLARNQQSDGLWSLAGPYKDGANVENQKAATAMALLAFQGAGYTHKGNSAEPFTQIVARGWHALLKQQSDDGSFLGDYYHHVLYTHAQCSIALCELYAMTRDESLRAPAERAVAYCLKA